MLCRREVEKLEHWISSSVLAVVNIIGLHVNGFIVAVNLMDMRTGRTLKPIDRILLSLGLCQLCLQTLLIIVTLQCFALLSDIPLDTHNIVSSAIYKSLEYCSFWFTAWLCFLYSVKIVNCEIRMFLALKVRIPQMVLPAILGSLIIAVISGCLFAWRFKVTYGNPLSRNISSDLEFDVVLHPFVFGHFLPFSIIAISSLFLLYTLINHVCRLKQSSSSFTFNRMDFYLSSIRYLILLFLVSALKLTSAISLGLVYLNSFLHVLFKLISFIYPTFQAFVVCLGNSKLRQACCKVVVWIKQCLTIKQAIHSNIETIHQ